MSNITITLANSIQTTSLQLGDVAYSVSPPRDPDNIGQSYSNDEIKEVGVIIGVDGLIHGIQVSGNILHLKEN